MKSPEKKARALSYYRYKSYFKPTTLSVCQGMQPAFGLCDKMVRCAGTSGRSGKAMAGNLGSEKTPFEEWILEVGSLNPNLFTGRV